MLHAKVTRIIDAPHDVVWPLLADVTTVDKWHPAVKDVDLVGTTKTGIGATRVCNFYDGTSVKETVTFDDGKHLNLVLSEYSIPMKEFDADIYAVPNGNKTQVTFSLNYIVKYGPVGYVMGKTIMKYEMKKLVTKVLAGIDYHLATGEVVGKDFVPPKPQ